MRTIEELNKLRVYKPSDYQPRDEEITSVEEAYINRASRHETTFKTKLAAIKYHDWWLNYSELRNSIGATIAALEEEYVVVIYFDK